MTQRGPKSHVDSCLMQPEFEGTKLCEQEVNDINVNVGNYTNKIHGKIRKDIDTTKGTTKYKKHVYIYVQFCFYL